MIIDKYKANLTGYWDFSKGSLANQSGVTANLTMAGTPYWGKDNKGREMVFDGATDYFTQTGVFPTTTGSLATTFMWGGSPSDVIAGCQTPAPNERCYIAVGGNILAAGIGTQSFSVIVGTTTLVKGRTYHGVVTWDGSNVNLYLNGVNEYSAAQSGAACTGEELWIGADNNNNSATAFWEGGIRNVLLFNAALTPQDVSELYNETSTSVPYNAVNFKSKDRYINAVADSDMQKTGTADFTPVGAGVVLSKVVDAEKGQVLSVYAGGGVASYGYQYNLKLNTYYRLRGWIRADGSGGIARMKVGDNWMTGFNNTATWAYVDEVLGSGSTNQFRVGEVNASVNTAYFKDIECIELTSADENAFASPKAYIADGKGWNQSTGNVTAGQLEQTGWEVQSGTWKVSDGDGFNKIFECVATGSISLPMTQAFGTWEFDINKDAASAPRILFMNQGLTVTGAFDGYRWYIDSNEKMGMAKYVATASTILVDTTNAYISAATWYRIRITRTKRGEFTVYVSSDGGLTYTAMAATGGTPGTNPFTDLTVTSSLYTCVDLDTGDKIKNFKFIPYIE